MNHIKVVFALTLVVLGFSLAVFGVNEWTAPIIQARKDKLANEAKFEVLPALDATADEAMYKTYFTTECPEEVQDGYTCDDETYEFTSATVSKVNVIEGKGYIYEVTYGGYAGPVTYLIALDTEGIVTGFKVVAETETTDVGHKITEDAVKNAFPGLTLEETYDLDYDTLAGATATITWAGLVSSLQDVKEFHGVNFEGVVLETPEERLARLKDESTGIAHATYADVTANYTLDSISIIKVETVNTDAAMLYTVEFSTTYSEVSNQYLVALDMATSKVLGLRVLRAGDTLGYGSTFAELDYDDQFTDMTFDDVLAGNIDAMAGTSGAPLTTGALKASMVEVVEFHNTEVLGIVEGPEEAPLEKLQAAYPGAVTFTSIYADMTQDDKILNIYEAKDGSDAVIGYVYFGEASGNGGKIKFLWSVDASDATIELVIVSDSESWEFADYGNSHGNNFTTSIWLDNFDGIQIDSIIATPVDTVAGVSESTGGMNAALTAIATYHGTENVGGAE